MKVSHAHENLFLYLCVHSLSCTIKWFNIEMVFVMVVRSSCLDCRYFVIGFSICKNCSNIKSYPPLAKGIPLQLTLGNPYLTNHIGVDCCWPLVRETESLLYWYSPVKDKKNFVSKISLLFIRLFIPWLLMASRKHTTKVYTQPPVERAVRVSC